MRTAKSDKKGSMLSKYDVDRKTKPVYEGLHTVGIQSRQRGKRRAWRPPRRQHLRRVRRTEGIEVASSTPEPRVWVVAPSLITNDFPDEKEATLSLRKALWPSGEG